MRGKFMSKTEVISAPWRTEQRSAQSAIASDRRWHDPEPEILL
jgi:hypothetical protein